MISNSMILNYEKEELETEKVINLLECDLFVLRKKWVLWKEPPSHELKSWDGGSFRLC